MLDALLRPRILLTLPAFAMMWIGASSAASAQATGTIAGQVVEADNLRPLGGARISLPALDRETPTGADGRYRIENVPVGDQPVRVSLIGYGTLERTVTVAQGETITADFEMSSEAVLLDELVVTGTPLAVSRRELGNVVSTIDAVAVTENSTVGNTVELIQGKAPGVQILPNAGTPGAAADIRIRGANSFIGNEPVVYIDGVRANTGSLGNFAPSGASTTGFSAQRTSAFDLIDPRDIESIEIIKGPAAATLYGAEAASGVIQVITKKGARGDHPMRVDVQYEQGLNDWALDIPDNHTVCTTARIDEEDAAGEPIWPGCQGVSPGEVLTDNPMRRDPRALRTGDLQRAALSARGGSERISYYVSGTTDREQGVFRNSSNDRTSLRANFSAVPSDRFDFQFRGSYVRGDLRLPLGDESAQALLLSAVRGQPGHVPPANDPEREGWSTVSAEMANSYNNQTDSDRFTLGATINARPLPWFRNRLTLGLDNTSSLAEILSPPGSTDAEFAGVPDGVVAQRQPRTNQYTVDYAGSLEFGLTENLESTTSFGMQAISRETETVFASGTGFGAPEVLLIGAAESTSGSNSFSESKSLGYYLQEQVGWKDRLFVTGAVRADDHSAFGTDFDLLLYPKASLSWVLSEEPALASTFATVGVDDFKLNAAYGHAGRAPSPFTATQAYTVDKVAVGGEQEPRSALRVLRLGNPDLRAERGEEFELGFQAGLLDDRVGLELTYYNNRMRDVISATGVAGSSGFAGTFYGGTSARFENLAETLNTGVELTLQARPVRTRPLVWESRLNLAASRNELVSFGDERTSETPFAPYGAVQQHRPGYPLAGYWAQLPLRNADGTPVMEDGVVQLDTATFIGPSQPTRQIGLSNTFTLFRDLRVFAFLDYKGGHHLFNYKEYNRCRFNSNCARLADPANVDLATGEAENPEVNVWRQSIPGAWIEEADFVKLRDVSVTYTLPERWVSPIRANSASLTLAGHNLAQWTDYSGIDPETNTYGNRDFARVDAYAAPMIRRLSMRLNLTF